MRIGLLGKLAVTTVTLGCAIADVKESRALMHEIEIEKAGHGFARKQNIATMEVAVDQLLRQRRDRRDLAPKPLQPTGVERSRASDQGRKQILGGVTKDGKALRIGWADQNPMQLAEARRQGFNLSEALWPMKLREVMARKLA